MIFISGQIKNKKFRLRYMKKEFKKFIKYLNENNSENLSQLILKIGEEFTTINNCTLKELNNGLCVDFVDEIQNRFNDNFDTLTTSQFIITDEKNKNYWF